MFITDATDQAAVVQAQAAKAAAEAIKIAEEAARGIRDH